MSKKMFCVCGLYLGELAPGSKFKKNMVFLCANCNTKRIASDMANKGGTGVRDFDNIFGDIFKK